MIARLKDMRIRQQLKKEISADPKDWENIYLGSGGASGIQISSVTNRELEKWQGKRLSEVAAARTKIRWTRFWISSWPITGRPERSFS